MLRIWLRQGRSLDLFEIFLAAFARGKGGVIYMDGWVMTLYERRLGFFIFSPLPICWVERAWGGVMFSRSFIVDMKEASPFCRYSSIVDMRSGLTSNASQMEIIHY